MVLYSNDCPRCIILEKKLNDKVVKYEKINDITKIVDLGFKSAPILEFKGEYLEFIKANELINSL